MKTFSITGEQQESFRNSQQTLTYIYNVSVSTKLTALAFHEVFVAIHKTRESGRHVVTCNK
jgi:hypothetical protein